MVELVVVAAVHPTVVVRVVIVVLHRDGGEGGSAVSRTGMIQKIWREKFKRGRLKIKPNEAVDRKKVSAQHRTRHSRDVLVSPIFYLTDSSLAAEIILVKKRLLGNVPFWSKRRPKNSDSEIHLFPKFPNGDVFNFF